MGLRDDWTELGVCDTRADFHIVIRLYIWKYNSYDLENEYWGLHMECYNGRSANMRLHDIKH